MLIGKKEFAGQKLPTGQFTFVAGRRRIKEGVREKETKGDTVKRREVEGDDRGKRDARQSR
jgi:hypothetical protein